MGKFIYIDSISFPVTNLGPGKRIALWVRGCSLKCVGCMAKSMQKRSETDRVHIAQSFKTIKELSPNADGITISGGEPFEQPEGLYELIKLIKNNTLLDIMVYSGYTLEELKKQGHIVNKILNMIDILVDGRFDEGNTNKKLWRGSDNQKFHILSERAKKYARYADKEYSGKRELHIEMAKDNSFKIIGIPDREFVGDLKKRCGELGLILIEPQK